MDKTCCFPTACGRRAWHRTTAHRRRCFVALSLIFANLCVVRAEADELLLGNHLYRPESSQVVTAESEPTSDEPQACLSCIRVGNHRYSCEVGERWTLSDLWSPCGEPVITIGGWQQLGYDDQSTGLFNAITDRIDLHQSWLYAEKTTDTSQCNWDWGFRADILYGIDAEDSQAFGNNPGRWDFLNGFDHGSYAWAIPQVYGEVAYKDLSITIGHFFTIAGYEVVPAPDNFFFSHAYTFDLSEPFTHTGVLTSYAVDERLTLYNGWTLGWDTGFDQRDQGNTYLGGVKIAPRDGCSFTYITSIGNLGERGRNAYAHFIVADLDLTEGLKYVFQSDLLQVNETGENTVGINQYLIYTLNDRVAVGSRVEWWKADGITAFTYGGQIAPPTSSSSYYEATIGVNVKPHANFIVRPEFRYDWAPFADYEQSIFAIDMILTY